MLSRLDLKRTGFQFVLMIVIGFMILIGQYISKGTSIITALPGMGIMIGAAMLAMILKDLFPKSMFPAFGFATIIGLLLSIPGNPISEVFSREIGNINFMAITTPLLAFAGISVGNKIEELKKMSWKIVLISLVVFTTIFFACASIGHAVLKMSGVI